MKMPFAQHGIGCAGKTVQQMTRSDYDRYDLLIGMDSWNIRNMRNICTRVTKAATKRV